MSVKKRSGSAGTTGRTAAQYTSLVVHPVVICPLTDERKKLARKLGVPVFASHEEFTRTILCNAAQRCDEQIVRARSDDASGSIRYLDQMTSEIRGTIWGDAELAKNLKLLVERAGREIAQWIAANPRKGGAEGRPVVTFSNNFMTVNCSAWRQSESRARARQAQNILRSLFENWRDHNNAPIPVDTLLRGVSTGRLDVALSKGKYPQTWSLIREDVSEATGLRTVWLADGFDYRVS